MSRNCGFADVYQCSAWEWFQEQNWNDGHLFATSFSAKPLCWEPLRLDTTWSACRPAQNWSLIFWRFPPTDSLQPWTQRHWCRHLPWAHVSTGFTIHKRYVMIQTKSTWSYNEIIWRRFESKFKNNLEIRWHCFRCHFALHAFGNRQATRQELNPRNFRKHV